MSTRRPGTGPRVSSSADAGRDMVRARAGACAGREGVQCRLALSNAQLERSPLGHEMEAAEALPQGRERRGKTLLRQATKHQPPGPIPAGLAQPLPGACQALRSKMMAYITKTRKVIYKLLCSWPASQASGSCQEQRRFQTRRTRRFRRPHRRESSNLDTGTLDA